MGEVIDIFTRQAVVAPPPTALQQNHFAFCADDLTNLFYTTAHFIEYDPHHHLFYAAKLKAVRALQRDHVLPAHADTNQLRDLILARDFAGVKKFESDLQIFINEIECDRESRQMTEGQWLSATGGVDCVPTSILQDTRDLLEQAERDVLLQDRECGELARLAKKDPDGLIEYAIGFVHTQYKSPAESHLQNLIDARLVSLGLKQKQPHLRPV